MTPDKIHPQLAHLAADHLSPRIAALTLIIAFTLPASLCAQEAASPEAPGDPSRNAIAAELAAPKPITVSDPSIPVDHLALRLDPLTVEELGTEATAWRDLVKAKAAEIAEAEIAEAEIAARTKNKETAAQDEGEKQASLTNLAALREQKDALLERFDTVLDAWELKGGDAESYRKYAAAVSGISVEVTDAAATWAAAKGWLTSKEGGIKLGLRALQFIAIMAVFWILAKVVERIVRAGTALNRRMSALLKSFIDKMVRRSVVFIGLLVALSSIDVNVGALLALIGGGAFIIGFALQDTLGNFAAGLMLLAYRPFDVGDIVEIGGVTGKVDGVSLVNTTIRSFDNKVILVPNREVWGQTITNATASPERRVDLVFGIGYDDDADQAREILERLVREHKLVLADPEPVIQLNELADSSVNFVCRPWAKTADYWTVYWDITREAKKAFDAAGISIPYPQRDVHVFHAEKKGEAASS